MNEFFRKAVLAVLCAVCFHLSATAQRVTRQYNNVSFSSALKDLNAAQDKYAINFVYDELEDFKVTKSIRNQSVPDAIRQLIGFYPINMTQMDNVLVVECTQKAPTKMIGRIVDAHRRPVDFANVAILNVVDSTVVTGGVTNENGQFVIPCAVKKAIVRVSCVGYQTASGTYNTGKVGTIVLKDMTMHLQRVVVKSTRPVTTVKGNALVTNVAGSQLSHAGTANDVLRQVPMVTGRDGNFEVFGKGKPLIYINGRTVQDNNELSQLNSQDIKNVEVITNPGAKYDASVKGCDTYSHQAGAG